MAILTNPNDLPVPKAEAVMSTVDADDLRQRRAAADAVLRDFVKVLAAAEAKRFARRERGVSRGIVLAGIAVAALAAVIIALAVAG